MNVLENELNEPCYQQDWESTNIKSSFKINGKTLEIEQRMLSFGEVEQHQFNLKSAYKDPTVYKALLKEDDIESKLSDAKKSLNKQIKKDKSEYDKKHKKYTKDLKYALKNITEGETEESIKESFKDVVDELGEMDSKLIKTEAQMSEHLKDYINIDDDTKYLLFESKLKLEENKKLVNTKLIAYSTSPSTLFGGYFKINGKQLNLNETCIVLQELNQEIFNHLFINANKLSFPTVEEIENVK